MKTNDQVCPIPTDKSRNKINNWDDPNLKTLQQNCLLNGNVNAQSTIKRQTITGCHTQKQMVLTNRRSKQTLKSIQNNKRMTNLCV